VKVNGHCYRNNQPVIEVVSSFRVLYRGRFVDYENTFDTTDSEELDYLVHLENDDDDLNELKLSLIKRRIYSKPGTP
jgi:fatty acid synthase subunit beta